MDPRKIVFVVLAAAFTVGAGELQATSSAGAQSETALPPGPDRDTVRSESELIDVLARAYRSMDLDLYATLRFATWTGVPIWIWLGISVASGLLLLRS